MSLYIWYLPLPTAKNWCRCKTAYQRRFHPAFKGRRIIKKSSRLGSSLKRPVIHIRFHFRILILSLKPNQKPISSSTGAIKNAKHDAEVSVMGQHPI